MVRYINTHYMEDITLLKLSDQFYMSSTYLSRTFRKVMGMTYSEYLIRVRIRQDIHLLNHTKMRVTEIVQKTGFHSDNHFCKMFLQITGVLPLKYRISIREK